MSHLSPYRLGKAREVYSYFNVTNAISWNLLVGSIIILFAMRLNAPATFIGLITAAFYLALLLLPLGKLLARRFSIIKVFGFAWTLRALCMLLVVAAPIAEYFGYRDTALLLVLLGVLSFHFFRGIGIVGNNPVLSLLCTGADRGSYLTQIQIVNGAAAMFGSFLMAMILGRNLPVFIYSIFFGIGVISGILSGYFVKKLPEPPSEPDGEKIKLIQVFREVLADNYLRRFIIIFFLIAFVSGVTRAFVVVYAREVFAQNDGMVSLFTVFGNMGYLMIGLCIKFFVDRTGAKPIFIVCTMIGLASMLPVIFYPGAALVNMTSVILFLSFLFFMLNFGFLGSEGIAQTYFMALIPTEKMLNMGILFFFIYGTAGASGSFLTGLLLDLFSAFGFSPFISFKILFSFLFVLTAVALVLQKGLKSLGSLSLKGALEVIFSIRDIKAISLLDKLNKTQDSKEEAMLLGALRNTPSSLATTGLLERARSPRLSTRMQSIRALEKLPYLTESAEKALLDDIVNHPYTTAYISASLLGKHGCVSAIPLLRELALSDDYMLAGEALIALARLKDFNFRERIEEVIKKTNNPRLKIMGAEALGLLHSHNSLPVLLDILRGTEPPPYLRDEVVLAISAILDTQHRFYPVLVKYLSDKTLAFTLGMDEAEAAYEFYKSTLDEKKKKSDVKISSAAENFASAVSKFIKNNDGTELSQWISELPDNLYTDENIAKTVLSQAVIDTEINVHNRLRLLIIHWAAIQLCTWTKAAKDNKIIY